MKEPFQKDKYLRSAAGGGERPLRPHFQDFHRLQTRGSHEYPAHQHASYEVILVARGPYTCSLNGQELEVREKELLVIKPGDWHQDHLRKGQQHYVLHFSLGEYRGAAEASVDLFEKGISASAQTASYPAEDDFRLFSTLEREALKKDEYSAAIQDATLEAFFWRMVRHFPAEVLSPAFRQRSGDQVFVDRLYRMFERQYMNNLTVEELAKDLHMSKRSLSMKCREVLSDSPARLFNRFKVQKAVKLLVHTSRPVKEIAFDLGFENPYHFSRVFKTFYGAPPSSLQ